jgi:hypothetical protein
VDRHLGLTGDPLGLPGDPLGLPGDPLGLPGDPLGLPGGGKPEEIREEPLQRVPMPRPPPSTTARENGRAKDRSSEHLDSPRIA